MLLAILYFRFNSEYISLANGTMIFHPFLIGVFAYAQSIKQKAVFSVRQPRHCFFDKSYF